MQHGRLGSDICTQLGAQTDGFCLHGGNIRFGFYIIYKGIAVGVEDVKFDC